MGEYRDLALQASALADENRLRIIAVLASASELSVTDVVMHFRRQRPAMSQPLISWHLRALRRRGVIDRRREGRQVYYALNRRTWSRLIASLESLVLPRRLTGIAPRAGEELGFSEAPLT